MSSLCIDHPTLRSSGRSKLSSHARDLGGGVKMKPSKTLSSSLWSLFLTCLLVTVCAAQQYQPTGTSAREAIASGQAKEFVSAMEVQAQEAEKNGNWVAAASAYNEATFAAQNSGQLQKALSYAGRALEFAEKARDQELRVRAIYFLAGVHANLRQYEKAREWTEKGIEGTRKLLPGVVKESYEGFFIDSWVQTFCVAKICKRQLSIFPFPFKSRIPG
jgi:tetratricopeptide (TPR) repeat protein